MSTLSGTFFCLAKTCYKPINQKARLVVDPNCNFISSKLCFIISDMDILAGDGQPQTDQPNSYPGSVSPAGMA